MFAKHKQMYAQFSKSKKCTLRLFVAWKCFQGLQQHVYMRLLAISPRFRLYNGLWYTDVYIQSEDFTMRKWKTMYALVHTYSLKSSLKVSFIWQTPIGHFPRLKIFLNQFSVIFSSTFTCVLLNEQFLTSTEKDVSESISISTLSWCQKQFV